MEDEDAQWNTEAPRHHHKRSQTDPTLRFPTPELLVSATISKVWNGAIVVQEDTTLESPLDRQLTAFTQRRNAYHDKRIAHYVEQRRNRPSTHLCLLVNDMPPSSRSAQSHQQHDNKTSLALPPPTTTTTTQDTEVICTTDPIGRTKKLNEDGNRFRLKMIIGPFNPRNGLSGKVFENILKHLATDKHGRMVIGVKMAMYYKLDICGVPTREHMLNDLQQSMKSVPDSIRNWDPASISANANRFSKKHYNVRVS